MNQLTKHTSEHPSRSSGGDHVRPKWPNPVKFTFYQTEGVGPTRREMKMQLEGPPGQVAELVQYYFRDWRATTIASSSSEGSSRPGSGGSHRSNAAGQTDSTRAVKGCFGSRQAYPAAYAAYPRYKY